MTLPFHFPKWGFKRAMTTAMAVAMAVAKMGMLKLNFGSVMLRLSSCKFRP